MRWRAVLGIVLLWALPALAEGPAKSPRPQPRPVLAAPVLTAPVVAAPVQPAAAAVPQIRPKPRPLTLAQPVVTAQPDASIRRLATLRPRPRPANMQALVADAPPPAPDAQPEPRKRGLFNLALAPDPGRAKVKPEPRSKRRNLGKETSRKGSVCGDPAIKGEEIARITSKVKGCGVDEAVRITSVSGVALSQGATIDCATARALKTWVDKGLQPAFGRTRVVELKVAAHYICRSRNNIKGNKISEHGRGKAIDISGVVLESGKTVMVAGGYGKELRSAHKAACGIFGTTLGPGSDGFHEDHLHFDTADHRGGSYCR